MLTIIFFVLFFMVFGKLIGFAFKVTWNIMKVMLFLVFLPLILVGMAVGGLAMVAIPILLVVGLFSLLAKE